MYWCRDIDTDTVLVVTAKVLTCQETTERWFQTNFAYLSHITYQNKENLKSVSDPLGDSW